MEAAAVGAVLSATLNVIANKVAPLIVKRYSSIVGVAKDLQELQDLVEEVNYLLSSVAYETMENDRSLNWLKKLKDVASAVDDVVDEFQLKAEEHDAAPAASRGILSNMWAKPKSLIFQCRTAGKVRSIKHKFAKIVKQRTDFTAIANSLLVGHPVCRINNTTAELPSLSIVDAALVLGRDEEKQKIISKLVETNDQQGIKIVSIIGLGGSGKSTLAKLVFNDHKDIRKHFDIKLWVHVSQEFNPEKLIKKLFEAFADKDPGDHSLPYMSTKITINLTGKRFLLVLDDVWSDDPIHWDTFMAHLRSGSPGSKILLTARSSRVAKTMGSTDLFDLPFLSPDDSWQLFQRSLIMPARGWTSDFEMVGKEIVHKCGGVPLAIKAFAGVLRDKEHIEQWEAIRDSNLLDVEGKDHRVAACLRLSYYHLPSHLKKCFTMCSVFPKGHEIYEEQLIDQWIAHDMIAKEDGVDLEHTGHKYFCSLVQMSFLKDVDGYNDDRVRCRMHDLVHDLARSILGSEISLVVPANATRSTDSYIYFCFVEQPPNLLPKNIFKKTRAIYVDNGDSTIFGMALKDAKHLRSITMKSIRTTTVPTALFLVKYLKYLEISGWKCETLPDAISDFWSLQALYLTLEDLLELPKSLGKLQKLRTLNLSWCRKLKRLPVSIGDCHMISTLDLSYCKEFEELPNSIGTNKRLRVLRLCWTEIKRLPSSIVPAENLESLNLERCGVTEIPSGIGQLSRLEKLGKFPIGFSEDSARISELATLARISGHLKISHLERVTDPCDARRACLKQKENLHELTLSWGRLNNVNPENEAAVLDGLEPPSGIKRLRIYGYAGMRPAQWMLKQDGGGAKGGAHFQFLTTIKLVDLPYLKHLEGLVDLPCLKWLCLCDMPALESISGGPFSSQVTLHMATERMLADEEGEGSSSHNPHYSGQVQTGSCLTRLDIQGCPKLEVKPYFPSSLEHLTLTSSNERLLQFPGRGEGPSSSFSCYLPSLSLLKELELSYMKSGRGWELLQHVPALTCLMISSCVISELPESIGNLKSLRSLHIIGTPIRSLPAGIQGLTALQQLNIRGCPDLRTRCERGNGADWHLISHIPCLEIY